MSNVPFHGIFYSYFKNYTKDQINKLVKIKTNGDNPTCGPPDGLINPDVNSSARTDNWQSSGKKNSSFTISLLRERILVSSYSLRSRLDADYNTPYEWVLEGSNDLKNWVQIHHKPKGDELVRIRSEGNWICNTQKSFSSFKLTQLNENYNNSYLFSLNKIELFGKLSANDPITCYKRYRFTIQSRILLYALIS